MRSIWALAVWLVATTAAVASEPVLLFQQDSWIVFRGEAAGNPVCDARVGITDETFEIFGNLASSVMRVRLPAQHFEQRQASVVLRVGPNRKIAFGDWTYQEQFVALVGPTDVIDALASGLDVPGGAPLEVLDETNNVLATFDIKGIGAALKAWRSCLDHWTDAGGNWAAPIQ